MRLAFVVGLGIFLFPFFALAGTWLDTFDEKHLDWQELILFGIDDPGTWEIIDGELQAIGDIGGVTRLLTVGEEAWQDYEIEFDIKPLEKHGAGNLVVAARITGTSGVVCGVGDLRGPAAEPMVECFAGNLHERLFLVYGEKPHPLLKLRKWSTFKLAVHGKLLTFWINGKQVLDPITLESLHGFPDFPIGRVGLGLAGYTVRFDNFKITGPSIPNRGGLSVTPQTKLATTWGNLKQF